MESYYGGMGPMLNAVLWVQVVIFAIFVGLRLYTRSQILHSVGADDYLVVVALVFQIIYSAFVTAGTKYGLGRKFADIGNPDAYFRAVELEIYSQVAGLMVIGLGKCAVGIFLLRIVRNKFQKAFIWAFLAGTVFITLFSSIVVVVQCDPVQRTWDRRVPGTCWIDFSKVGLTVGSWFVVADFCFAILPWFVIWELNMKRKEKITVACGLSLGIFAGICGIVRTVALNGLNASEYIYDTVDMLIWSATESTVTIMCSSIPVLRPLYVRFRYGSSGDSSGAASSYKLPMYGNYSGRKYGNSSMPGTEAISGSGPSNKTVIAYNANASDESILRDAKTQNNISGIRRTDEVSISYGKQDARERKAVSDHGDFTPAIFNAVLEELRHEADIFEQAGLIPVMDLCIAALKFDKLLTDELVAEIKSAVAPLENVPEEQKDWHPGTHHQMLDLVHREGIRDEVMEERDARVKEFDSELIRVEYRFCEH
ncbi:hypothetical protein H9L39_04191 [Fusarium oxysporum f. sp. albedinis]|nr:hypothetical protein H9L39_04191 [Fusarium oxysporum f. sp. albedinis]